MPTTIDPVLEAVDHALAEVAGRDLVEAASLADLLLDIRIIHLQEKESVS